ncbi:fungal-specific transcription factor domain-containing protein [Lentinula detonsa]|uniref:Fungal-specific transcription factor domain-containing protein n=1 Tax=Lentinula detonsa TaxID=2804962 RepID=A0AA38PVE2_9AGAR|nr:fungal-specific transcription factor domain-containing protein [Lentinula detonsa]
MSFESKSEDNLHSFSPMSSQEKTDIRRVQGQISCAECRRLKLKCDKKIPCSSCVRRGFSSLCPTKSLITAPAKRIDTAALQKKVQAMNQHIRHLEKALSTLHATTSTEPHPLLAAASGHEFRGNSFPGDTKTAEMVDSLGTLSLGKLGDARYLGRSAGSESLLEGSPEVLDTTDEDVFIPPDGIAQLVNSFPLALASTWDVESSVKLILTYLPEKDRAWTLAEGFLTHNFWYITIVTREELFDELLIPVYQSLSALDTRIAGWAHAFPLSPTRLAVLFICLAHGSLADRNTPLYSAESALFFNVSRASLSLYPVLVSPDLASVQALTLIGSYHGTGGPDYSIEAGWIYLTIAAKLTHSLGLHRESPRWGLDDKTVQRRRAIFWELYTFDGLISLDLGRPPSLFTAHCDTPLPLDQDDGVDDQGNLDPGFHRWRMTFSKDVITAVSRFTLSPCLPDYQAILDLDRLVREHPLPQKYDPLRTLSDALEQGFTSVTDKQQEDVGYEATLRALKGHHLTQFRAVVVMHVHRAFFAQALLQSPSDPLNSVYAPSFIAAYRIASTMVHLNVRNFYKYSEVLSRYWEIWTGLLSAGITLGLIVARSPTCPIAANAYTELGLAVELFKMGAPRSDKAKRGLNVLLRMYDKATKSYLSTNSQENTAKERMNVIQEDADALHMLETFAGYTKILMKEMKSSRENKDNQNTDSDWPEASGQYQSNTPDSVSKFYSSEDTHKKNAQSGQETNYSLSFSPSSSSSSSSTTNSSDYISHWQTSDHAVPVGHSPYMDYDPTVSISPSNTPPVYSFERGVSGISSTFRFGVGTSDDTSSFPNPPSTRLTNQRGYSDWNSNQSQPPLPVHQGGSYGTRPFWQPTQPETRGTNPSLQLRMNQGQRLGHMGYAANNPPGGAYITPVNAQWEEMMRDEGVWSVDN